MYIYIIYKYIYIYIYNILESWCKRQLPFLSKPKTSKNRHDWTPIKYLNVLHHNRIQKQLLKKKIIFS